VKGLLVLTPIDARYGFALAGVRQQEVAVADVWSVLREATTDPQVGVVAVDGRLLAAVDQSRLRELTSRWSGVLVTLPAPAGAAITETDELQRLVRRALGYHVKL
jgi:V/A-type H+-transporting ATPase subunit F